MKHFSPHMHRNPMTQLKRRATYFLAFLVAVVGGYLVLSAWDDSITGATSRIPEKKPEFALSASFALPENGFDVSDVTLKVTMGAGVNFSGGLLVDGLHLEGFQGASLVLSGYDGNLVGHPNGFITIDGKADSVIMNNVVLNRGGTLIRVEASSLQYDAAEVSGVSAKSFSIVSVGTIDVTGKGSFTVNNEKVDMKYFNGVVEMDGSGLKLTGSARSLLIDGAPRVSIE